MSKVRTRVRTRVTTHVCPLCQTEMYSRSRHDFRYCPCLNLAVDGGFDYVKILYRVKPTVSRVRYVNATKAELFQDWNNGTDMFGVIKGAK